MGLYCISGRPGGDGYKLAGGADRYVAATFAGIYAFVLWLDKEFDPEGGHAKAAAPQVWSQTPRKRVARCPLRLP